MTDLTSFELYLLGLMRGRGPIGSAPGPIGASADSIRSAAPGVGPAVGFLDLVAKPLAVYTDLLGAPLETLPEPGLEPDGPFGGSMRHRFPLRPWPDFQMVLRTHPDGWVWGPELVRRPGASAPEVRSPGDLVPWTIVESEVIARFGPFATADSWNLGTDATYAIEAEGGRFEVALAFDLKLLQGVEVAPISKN